MKRIIAGLSALALMAAPITAFADAAPKTIDQNTLPPVGSAEISTEIAPSFFVEIPSDTKIPFNSLETPLGDVKLTEARLDPGAYINIGISTADETPILKNKTDENKTIPYRFKVAGEGFVLDDFIEPEFAFFQKGDSSSVAVKITQDAWDAAYAGEYSDNVTFTIKYIKNEDDEEQLPADMKKMRYEYDYTTEDNEQSTVNGTAYFRFKDGDTWADIAANEMNSLFKISGNTVYLLGKEDDHEVPVYQGSLDDKENAVAVKPGDKMDPAKNYVAFK